MDFEVVATGFCFLEAPREDNGVVYFSDVVLGGIRRVMPDGRVDQLLEGRMWIGGMCVNSDGSVICSGGNGIAWVNPATRASGMLLEAIDGEPITGINELLPDNEGGLYFTTADVTEAERDDVEETRSPSALYRLRRDGEVRLLTSGYTFGNGIGLSPDLRRLYLNDTFTGTYGFDIMPDGSLANRVLLAEIPDADGLAVDSKGGIWVAAYGSGEIICVRPEGGIERRIALPVQGVTSLCFGGPATEFVYVATTSPDAFAALQNKVMPSPTASLYRATFDVPGRRVGHTDFILGAEQR